MNSFDFTTWVSDTRVYTAKEYPCSNYYNIFDKGAYEVDGVKWIREEVEHNIRSGAWKIVPRKVEKEKPVNTFTIKEGQIEAAARFIIANNSYLHQHTVDSMIEKIKCTIKRMVNKINKGEDAWYTGTAGYVVTIMQEDDNYYVVEVLVSPDVSQDKEFINVEDII